MKLDTFTIHKGDREICIRISRKRIKNINLRINSSGEVNLSAPYYASDEAIKQFLCARENWIIKNVERIIMARRIKDLQEVDKSKIYYLGEEHLIVKIKDNTNYVKKDNNKIIVYCKDVDNQELIDQLINTFLTNIAEKVIIPLFSQLYDKYRTDFPEGVRLRLIKMKNRYGTCYPKRKQININSRLIAAPVECIKYVIMHELSHLIESNHSPRFYQVLSRYVPDYKRIKKLIKEFL